MARKWSEKQSGALLGKWYALKSRGYVLLIIKTGEKEDKLWISYLFERDGQIESVDITVASGSVIPSVTQVFPQGEWMQKEIETLYHISFMDSSAGQRSEEDDSRIIEWGPCHPLLPEPMKLRILAKDEIILKTWIETGYNYRGIESLCIGRKAEEVLVFLERISTINSIPIALAFAGAVEKINETPVPEKSRWIRLIVNEMNMLQANLQGLNYTAQTLGLMVDSARIFNLICLYREATAQISEHPLFFDFLRIGGIHRDISRDKLYAVNAILQEMRMELEEIKKRWTNTPSIVKRLKGTGRLSIARASKLTGRLERAAGYANDSRKGSVLPYHTLSCPVPVLEDSDSYARIVLKLEDLLQSLDIIDEAIENLPAGEVLVKVKLSRNKDVIMREPEANGEIVLFVEMKGEYVTGLKIRNATALHIPFLPECLEGTELTDLPLVLSSFDLDLSGMEK